jgi:hypothetical protein
VLWKSKKIDMDMMMNGTTAYLEHQKQNQYRVCGAQVFLNQERWKDEWKTKSKTVNFPDIWADAWAEYGDTETG